jgi:hypothetical protein
MAEKGKKTYRQPTLKKWGTVADLTKTGLTFEGGDAKIGSAMSRGK